MYRRFLRICLMFALALPIALPFTLLHAQEAQSSPSASAASKPRAGEESKPESKSKDSGGSGEDEIRNSAGVGWIAKHTGLSLAQAYWLCVILNFSIVAVALFSFARKKLPVMFRNRTELIQKQIEDARKTSEEAGRRLGDVEGRLSRLDAEISEMRREAQENASAEERRILASVEEERKRIVSASEQEIGVIANAARRDLKTFAGALAVELAEKKIRVGKEVDQTLVRDFTAQLGKDGN
jgi:F-type H+-transporting ATPase subunit b